RIGRALRSKCTATGRFGWNCPARYAIAWSSCCDSREIAWARRRRLPGVIDTSYTDRGNSRRLGGAVARGVELRPINMRDASEIERTVVASRRPTILRPKGQYQHAN